MQRGRMTTPAMRAWRLHRPSPRVLEATIAAFTRSSREERRCAVANIRMGPAFGNAGHHWQDRLLATKGLSLALLVDAQQTKADQE
jgi:hypothetical protein